MAEEIAPSVACDAIGQAARGDPTAIGALLAAVEPILVKTAHIEFESRADYSRDDVVSELKMHLLAKLHVFDAEQGSLTTWVRAISKNYVRSKTRFLDAAKRRGSKVDFNSPAAWGDATHLVDWLVSQLPAPDSNLRIEERNAALAAAVLSLSEFERNLIIRRYYDEQPIADIAQDLGKTRESVDKLLIRTRRKLVGYLGSASRYFSSGI